MNTKTKLVMNFKNEDDKKITLSLDDPRTDLTEEEISDCMNLIIAKDVFTPGGMSLVSAIDAKVITTDTTEYDLV